MDKVSKAFPNPFKRSQFKLPEIKVPDFSDIKLDIPPMGGTPTTVVNTNGNAPIDRALKDHVQPGPKTPLSQPASQSPARRKVGPKIKSIWDPERPFFHPDRGTPGPRGQKDFAHKPTEREMAALSGNTVPETISRFGRATRRAQVEYSAQVHPLSGRIEGISAGDGISTPLPKIPRSKARRAADQLAENTSNPAIKARAEALAEHGSFNGMVGPQRLNVHNHPTTGGIRRAPSSMDRNMVRREQLFAPDKRPMSGAVTTPREAPRGGNKTHVTYFSPGPNRVPKRAAQTPADRDPNRMGRIANKAGRKRWNRADVAGQEDPLLREVSRLETLGPKANEASFRASQRMRNHIIRTMRQERQSRDQPIDYDKWVARSSRGPREATYSGLHTRTQVVKSASRDLAIGTAAGALGGALANQLPQNQRASAFSRKVREEKKKARAKVADVHKSSVSAFGVDHGLVSKRGPFGATGVRVANRVRALGERAETAGTLKTEAVLARNGHGKLSPAEAKKLERSFTEAKNGSRIRHAGEKMEDHPNMVGAVALSLPTTALGATALGVHHKRKKEAKSEIGKGLKPVHAEALARVIANPKATKTQVSYARARLGEHKWQYGRPGYSASPEVVERTPTTGRPYFAVKPKPGDPWMSTRARSSW